VISQGNRHAPRNGLYVGLMSGTSIDGVDAALVQLDAGRPSLVTAISHPIPAPLATALHRVSGQTGLDALLDLDQQVAALHADATLALLARAGVAPGDIIALGSHGQTVHHRPHGPFPTTLQIGDPSLIAARTWITTVADFRRRDMALGGQGAPLVPAFHAACLRQPRQDRAVLNLGGIANLTLLPGAAEHPVTGFDTGPANTLLDAWFRRHHPGGPGYDRQGRWAAAGRTDTGLLDRLLQDPYFHQPPPKSTGPEYFNLDWLAHPRQAGSTLPAPQDTQRTLIALTAESVTRALASALPGAAALYVCGGGVHNPVLMDAISAALGDRLPGCRVAPTSAIGLDPDWVEAMAFAWLAGRTLAGLPGNLPEVTGAQASAPLGGIYPAGCDTPA